MAEYKVIKVWDSIERNQDTKEIISHDRITQFRVGDTIGFSIESLLDYPDTVPISVSYKAEGKDREPKLIVAEMSKGEFRAAIAKAVGSEDMDKVNEALQATNRRMRKEVGGLAYSKEWVTVAAEIYKKLP